MKISENVAQWLDNLRFNRFHRLILLLAGLTLIFDGYDSQVVAYIMPLVLKEWQLTPMAAGSLASWGFLGLMIGAAGFGMLSDRFGRKKTLMLAIAIFSIFSGAAFFAPDFKTFITFRILAGLGMGGAMPITITLISEYAPAKIRAKAVSVMFGGFLLGWALAALVAMVIIPKFGWRPVLLLGVLPILYIPVLAKYLPESVRFLAGKERYQEAIVEMKKVEKLAGLPPVEWAPENFVIAGNQSKSSIKELFTSRLAGMTILVWLTYFCNLLVIYGLATWLPSLLVKSGFSLVKSYSYGMIQAMGGSVGGLILGWAMDNFGRKAALSVFYILGGLAVLFFGFASSNSAFLLAGAATGIFIFGTLTAQHVITGEIYPTHVRSTGVGWALTIGRLGSIIGPLLGGALQMANFSFRQYFLIFAIPSFACAVLVLLYRINVKGEGLEKITEVMVKKLPV